MILDPSYVRPIETLDGDALALAGGKGANLAALIEAGFPVPPGFVVTTDAYRSLIDTPAIRGAIAELDAIEGADSDALAEAAGEVRSLVRSRSMPEAVMAAITDALDSSNARATYAVRSSATAEDRPTASFAGQHDTVLGVPADEAADRVRECMASLFTDRAVAYRTRNDLSHSAVEMAVVVQVMIDAEAAGVLFTADPDTNNRTVASIDATYGLGDPVVSGAVSADNARVRKDTGEILDYEVGEKELELTLSETGTESIDAATSGRAKRVLTDDQLRALVGLGTRIEELFGEPQDIEWALIRGEFVVLQSRPITSLIAPPEPRPADGRLHVYMSVGHGQAMTDPMPPLALDLWERVYDDSITEMFGIDGTWMTRTEGRAYVDLTPVFGFGVTRDGMIRVLSAISEPAAAGAARLFEERRAAFEDDRSLAGLLALARTTVGSLPMATRWGLEAIPETIAPLTKGANGATEFRQWFEQWGRGLETALLDSEDPRELLENAFAGFPGDAFIEMESKAMGVVAGPVLGRVLERTVPNAEADLIASAGRGVEADVGTRMTLALGDLADVARETPAVERAILDERPYEELRTIEGSEDFVHEFETFLGEFGHRAASEFDPSRPRWREAPSGPLGIVRGNLIADEKGAHRERFDDRKREAKAAIEEIRSSARSGIVGSIRGPLVDRLLLTYRGYIHLRDEPKHEAAHLFAAWHEALQRVGEHLVREGILPEADDVWYCQYEELSALLDGNGAVPDIEVRRATHDRQKRIEAPPLITSEGEIPRVERDIGENARTGTGVSGGTIEGVARIVHDPSEAAIESGEVLVCPSTDPAWTPLFATAGGLVAEVGGRFTHGALVAREYGLPAVVSVAEATDRIVDGQRIRVDGDHGIVTILD